MSVYMYGRGRLTLEVFPTNQTGIHIYVGQRDGAQLLKVKVQNAPTKTHSQYELFLYIHILYWSITYVFDIR